MANAVNSADAAVALKTNELTDYEFENRTYNIYEYHYNIMLVHILMKNYTAAF
jgi:hypothetical protein